jgi:hypothetical protein
MEVARIVLIRLEQKLAESLHKGPEHFESEYHVKIGPVADLLRDIVGPPSKTAAGERPSPWGGYLAIDDARRFVVGTCAFKGPPRDGTVEIAYFTFPAFEGCGYATAMAMTLVETAKQSPEVRRIIARTLPEPNASTAVLKKLGMRLKGEVTDPDDGLVWEWELPNAA